MTPHWHTEQFKQTVLAAERPVLVDFHADWCGPCRSQGPIVDALTAEYAGRVSVGKVDIDADPDLAHLLQVRAIPTLLVFRRGKVAKRFTGLTDAAQLRAALDAALA